MPSTDHLPVIARFSKRIARVLLVLIGIAYTGWELWKLISEIRRGLRR